VSVGIQSGKDQVVIAVDPHEASWTAAAVDASLQPLASIRVPVSRDGSDVGRAGLEPATNGLPTHRSRFGILHGAGRGWVVS